MMQRKITSVRYAAKSFTPLASASRRAQILLGPTTSAARRSDGRSCKPELLQAPLDGVSDGHACLAHIRSLRAATGSKWLVSRKIGETFLHGCITYTEELGET